MRLIANLILLCLVCKISEALIFGRRRRRSPPVDCAVSGFSAWSVCPVSCGSGTIVRTRSVTRHPANGGAACPHLVENTKCNTQPCPINCQVSEFSLSSPCTASCGTGTTTRSRSVTRQPAHGGTACPHLTEANDCNTQPCPVDCQVSEFSLSSSCTASCETGTTTRSRSVTRQPAHGGTACPHLTETNDCNTQPCPVDCQVSEFSLGSPCTASCGTGTTTTSRSVIRQPAHGGTACPHLTETNDCNTQPCPINCEVSGFSDSSPCSASCGPGTTTRFRSVTRPPAHGGRDCPHLTETDDCNEQPCPINCQVTPWSPRSACDVTCGEGHTRRTREIVTQPQYYGKACPPLEEIEKCKDQPECLNYLKQLILWARTREGLGIMAVLFLALSAITRKCCGKKHSKEKLKKL